ncbi:hypothetical protein MMC30_008809 [Trapelia coarctata]|nr:hypothetical protein [Trapelia coarctata]
MALAVAASPVEVAKRNTPAQDAQQKCGNNLKASCCNSVTQGLGGLLGLNIGLGCTAIDVLSILPINQICSQQVACCQTGNQNGVINVGSICPIIL